MKKEKGDLPRIKIWPRKEDVGGEGKFKKIPRQCELKGNKNGEKNKSKGIHKESKDYASEADEGNQ